MRDSGAPENISWYLGLAVPEMKATPVALLAKEREATKSGGRLPLLPSRLRGGERLLAAKAGQAIGFE
jgi:hypothetical protein